MGVRKQAIYTALEHELPRSSTSAKICQVPFSQRWRRRLPSFPRSNASRRFKLSRRSVEAAAARRAFAVEGCGSGLTSRGIARVMPDVAKP